MGGPGEATREETAHHIVPAGSWGRRSVRELGTLDRAVYEVIATVPTPSLDRVLARLSHAANHSKVWLVGAGVLAVVGGDRGRRAALAGLASIGVSSMVTNVLGWAVPPLSLPLHLAAAAVAYSRVHTGVHYPGDTIAGALLGAAAATVVRRAAAREADT
jgi:PAP2 superfamily